MTCVGSAILVGTTRPTTNQAYTVVSNDGGTTWYSINDDAGGSDAKSWGMPGPFGTDALIAPMGRATENSETDRRDCRYFISPPGAGFFNWQDFSGT